MKLPNSEYAYIPRSKRNDYLLSETHIVGRLKAKFLRMLGFDDSNIVLLEKGLITIAQNKEIGKVISSPHGKK